MPVTVVSDAFGAHPARVEVRSPLDDRDLALLPNGPCVVQFSNPLTCPEHERLGQWFDTHPDAELRAYGQLPDTLDFLRHYPRLGGFTLDCAYRAITDATGLAHLPDTLHSLAIDVRLPGSGTLDVLARFRELRTLLLGTIRRLPKVLAGLPVTELTLSEVKTLDGISALPGVTTLRLYSVSADLAPLLALDHLTDLTLTLGGCRDLTPLAQLPGLRRFEAALVRGLADVSPVVGERLEDLHLASLRQVTALPPLTRARSLRRVHLQHMRGLADLAPLEDAPALQELSLIEMQHLQPENLTPLARHPTLATVSIGLGSNRKNLAARDLIQIPGNYGGHTWPPSAT